MFPTIPPRVDYDLSELGRKLIVPLQALYDWAVQHRTDMLAARARFAEKQRAAVSKPPSTTRR
jgi:DNA-binding HxlR family transcriptional regulator